MNYGTIPSRENNRCRIILILSIRISTENRLISNMNPISEENQICIITGKKKYKTKVILYDICMMYVRLEFLKRKTWRNFETGRLAKCIAEFVTRAKFVTLFTMRICKQPKMESDVMQYVRMYAAFHRDERYCEIISPTWSI